MIDRSDRITSYIVAYPFGRVKERRDFFMPKIRLPNGYGQIALLKSPRLRNKYRVRVIVSRNARTGQPKYETLGYYRTYADASLALADYHNKPKPLTRLTLEELYNEWMKVYPVDNKLSEARIRQITLCWNHVSLKRYCIRDLKPSDIRQDLMRDLPRSMPKYIKNLYDMLFDYAVTEQYVDVNVSRQVHLPKVIKDKDASGKQEKSAFTVEEIRLIKNMVGKNPAADVLYYSIFSGWRPSEAIELHSENVNLRMGFVVGGKKTAAGINRTVPIHNEIAPILKRYAHRKGNLFGFNIYATYRMKFCDLMAELGIKGHTPHDARRTFVTLAKLSGMDEYALKKIVGHSIKDLTEAVYTDRPVSWLIDEMNKITIPDKLTKAASE